MIESKGFSWIFQEGRLSGVLSCGVVGFRMIYLLSMCVLDGLSDWGVAYLYMRAINYN
jgi:hypothetical protein